MCGLGTPKRNGKVNRGEWRGTPSTMERDALESSRKEKGTDSNVNCIHSSGGWCPEWPMPRSRPNHTPMRLPGDWLCLFRITTMASMQIIYDLSSQSLASRRTSALVSDPECACLPLPFLPACSSSSGLCRQRSGPSSSAPYP